MHNDTACVGNLKTGCISMIRGKGDAGPGFTEYEVGWSYAGGFGSLMIRLDLNTIKGILRRG